jgi:hypothetical protein
MPNDLATIPKAARHPRNGLRLTLLGLMVMLCAATGQPGMARGPTEVVLFDFEDEADLKAWSNLEVEGAKEKEPPIKLERVAEHATSGKHSLKLTFGGGHWPTITTTKVLDDWQQYQTFLADVTASRPCVVGFTVLQEQSKRGQGWDEMVSRWTKTQILKAGKNQVLAPLRPSAGDTLNPKRGKVVRFEIFMYNPHDGESIYVDNIRLSTKKEESAPAKVRFTVAGTDLAVEASNPFGVASAGAVTELGKKFKDRWTKPDAKTVAQVEEEFKTQYAELKKKHPRAVFAVLRDGEKGYDSAQPDKAYAGWKDAYFTSHGPDGNYVHRAKNEGKSGTYEVFMRHRSPLMRVDLSSIPTGSQILAARLIVVRSSKINEDRDPEKIPTMWVVEPCNRPWEETEVNAFEYAKDKFWKEVGGYHWGEDPDFLPVFLSRGPSQGKVNTWDFAEAVRFWTDGKHTNHGFMLHGDSHDYMIAHSRRATGFKERPAVLVIYEPKQ